MSFLKRAKTMSTPVLTRKAYARLSLHCSYSPTQDTALQRIRCSVATSSTWHGRSRDRRYEYNDLEQQSNVDLPSLRNNRGPPEHWPTDSLRPH